jgi:hypothetical protein
MGGCLPDLMEYFDSLLARAIPACHGITGGCIEKGYNLTIADEGPPRAPSRTSLPVPN